VFLSGFRLWAVVSVAVTLVTASTYLARTEDEKPTETTAVATTVLSAAQAASTAPRQVSTTGVATSLETIATIQLTTTTAQQTTTPEKQTSTTEKRTTTTEKQTTTTEKQTTTTDQQTTTTEDQSDGSYSSSAESKFVSLINDLRNDEGLPDLKVSSSLKSYARKWSKKMGESGDFKHSNISSLLDDWDKVGENIAYGGSVDLMFRALKASPGHLENMLDEDFTHIGVGVWKDSEGAFWATHVFGG